MPARLLIPSLVVLAVLVAGGRAATPVDRVVPNDNRAMAGAVRDGVLRLRLEARTASWHPDGDSAPGAAVAAFAEEGGPARIPGPLLRVTAGTEVEVSLRNALAETLVVHGLHSRPDTARRLIIAPGARATVRFRLDAPGTYHYWGTTTGRTIDFRTREDAQLTGAIVVDDAAEPTPGDRILVIGMWTDTVARSRVRRERVLAVINGRSWPSTERVTATVGDSVRWRVINASADLHPMHLHGFFFRVDARGDGRGDTTYAPDRRALAVTEMMGAGATFRLTWVPERPGNWLFHCHIPEHFAPRGPLGLGLPGSPGDGGAHADHARGGMSGLVMGVTVAPRAGAADAAADGAAARRLRLLVRPQRGDSPAAPRFSYAFHEDGPEPPPDSAVGVGPTLDLLRGEPVRITIVNRLAEPTAVHWHGIELESYFDGVPGFSGQGARVTPLIAPGDSFVVRFTPPRAGTFIYHTHADEERQQVAGLAGGLVVHADAAARDTTPDVVLVLGEPRDPADAERTVLVNGALAPEPLRMEAGRTYRLRFIQMTTRRAAIRAEVTRNGEPAPWRLVAKDGADLPAALRDARPARLRFGIGETYDAEVSPDAEGEWRILVRLGVAGQQRGAILQTVPIVVTSGSGAGRR
jgi:manganese oxidase